ncbi:MAG: ZIP family metal transporter, partial [Endomicrobiia bacterium]
MNFILAIFATILVCFVSLVGIFSLMLNESLLEAILIPLLGFGAGGLIGGAFLHILPEVIGESKEFLLPFIYVIAGFVFFFIMEKFLYWRHCHNGKCDIHIFSYLNLIGDSLHNFIDGFVIGTSFVVDIRLGFITALAIIIHEIPQELGDFGVLLYGGFGK